MRNLFDQHYNVFGIFFDVTSFPYLNLTDPRTFVPGMPFTAYLGVRGTLPTIGPAFAADAAPPLVTKAAPVGKRLHRPPSIQQQFSQTVCAFSASSSTIIDRPAISVVSRFMARSGYSSGWWIVTSRRTSRSGQVGTIRWHLQPGRLRLQPIAQHLHLPEWKAAAYHRNSHRRQYASLSCLKARLRFCAFKMQCCPNTPARQIPRDLMMTPAMSPAHWSKPRLSNNHAGSAKKSRCSLRI